MMKLSTKGRYAARAMLELAMRNSNGPVMLKEIARAQAISERYLERIMAALVSRDLVHSLRGQHGGFTLAGLPSEIRLSDIVMAVEGPLAPVACVDDPTTCRRSGLCVTRDIWIKLKEAAASVLDSYTLEDLVRMQKDRETSSFGDMYHI